MQAKVQEWIYTMETFAGVECVQKDGQLCYHLCILKKEKNNAKIVQQVQNIPSLTILKSLLEEDTPIFLNINIKGILHRQLNQVPSSEKEALLSVFPSASIADFHVEQIEVSSNTVFVSVIRRDAVYNLLASFQAEGLWVLNAFVGPFWLEELLPILPPTVAIQTAQQLLEINEQHLVGFSKNDTPPLAVFNVGEEQVPEENLLALCMAFLAITQPSIEGLESDLIATQRHDFYYKKLFYYTSVLALGFFFLALLVNYFLFEHYNLQQQELKQEVAQQKNLLIQRDSLAKKYEDRKGLLGDKLHLKPSKSSFYADQLAATLPSTLQLTNLIIFPIIKEDNYSSEEKMPRYDDQKIVVAGECQGSVFYNNWKRSLEELDWVKSIHNISYQNGANGQGIFKLEITLNHD